MEKLLAWTILISCLYPIAFGWLLGFHASYWVLFIVEALFSGHTSRSSRFWLKTLSLRIPSIISNLNPPQSMYLTSLGIYV